MSSAVCNPEERKLEDDYFIIGTGLNCDRLRKDARQLQRSQFKETRSKAHFARYRNAALKCTVKATEKVIEKERSLRQKELEREKMELLEMQKRYEALLATKHTPVMSETKYKEKKKNKILKDTDTEGDFGASPVHNLSPLRACAETWMQRNHSLESDILKNNDLKTTLQSDEGSASRSHVTAAAKSNESSLKSDEFIPHSRATLPGKPSSLLSDSSFVLSGTKDESRNSSSLLSPSGSSISAGCPTRLSRASSSRTVRIHSVNLDINRRNSVKTKCHFYDERRKIIAKKEKKRAEQVSQNFDELLKWFADFMQIEYKPRLANKDSDVTKDVHAHNTSNILLPKGSLTPLYFNYGVPENCVIRLC